MPTYQYRCIDCDRDLEVVQKFSDPSLTTCPNCEGTLRKVFNAVGVVFKGSGFYRTDSRTTAGGGGSSSESSSDGKSDSSEKSSEKSPVPADSGKKEPKTGSSKPDKVTAAASGSSSTGSKAAGS